MRLNACCTVLDSTFLWRYNTLNEITVTLVIWSSIYCVYY